MRLYKASEILKAAAKSMAEGHHDGCCLSLKEAFAVYSTPTVLYETVLGYLELFKKKNSLYWFGVPRGLALNDADKIDAEHNAHTRVICLLLASEIAKSEGN